MRWNQRDYDLADREVSHSESGEPLLEHFYQDGKLIRTSYGSGLERSYAYDPETGLFVTPDGRPRYYYASDNLESERYRGLTPEDLIDIAVSRGIHFHGATQEGVVFHLIGDRIQFLFDEPPNRVLHHPNVFGQLSHDLPSQGNATLPHPRRSCRIRWTSDAHGGDAPEGFGGLTKAITTTDIPSVMAKRRKAIS